MKSVVEKDVYFPDATNFEKIKQIVAKNLAAIQHLYDCYKKKLDDANLKKHVQMDEVIELMEYCESLEAQTMAQQDNAWSGEEKSIISIAKKPSKTQAIINTIAESKENNNLQIDYKIDDGVFTRKYQGDGPLSDQCDSLLNEAFKKHNITSYKGQIFETENGKIKTDNQGERILASKDVIQTAVESVFVPLKAIKDSGIEFKQVSVPQNETRTNWVQEPEETSNQGFKPTR